MPRTFLTVLCLAVLALAGCGGDDRGPASYDGVFPVDGREPQSVAVSATPPRLSPAAACVGARPKGPCTAAMRRVAAGASAVAACQPLSPKRQGKRISPRGFCLAAAPKVRRRTQIPKVDPPGSTAPPGSAVLADSEAAARVRRVATEARPANTPMNRRVPNAAELAQFRTQASVSAPEIVTGGFAGTTDEILQWAAAKWGFDPDIVRAVAYVESRWRMSEVGDGGVSFGITQVKSTVHRGTAPLSKESTAFNADYWAAVVRDYYDGRSTWLNDVERGRDYAAGDLWGSIGAWYAGRWHTDAAASYIAKVKDALAARPWAKPGF